jgi:nitrogen-specific signal transduction histidine kinase
MIFQEIILGIPQGSEFKIYIQDSGNELEILIGEVGENRHLFETFDPELRGKPWSLGLFLNIAHKIISDHGGKLLLDSEGHTAFPVLVTIPRTISI